MEKVEESFFSSETVFSVRNYMKIDMEIFRDLFSHFLIFLPFFHRFFTFYKNCKNADVFLRIVPYLV